MTVAPHLKAAIFDLDGVITDTARLHARAWKELIDDYLERLGERSGEAQAPFDIEGDYRRYVDGKPRAEGLRSFFEGRGVEVPAGLADDPPDRETIAGLAARKDGIFQEVLTEEGVDLFQGTVDLVRNLRARGVRTAVASSSRNCAAILAKAGIADLFEARVDGETLRETGLTGKPDSDMFVEAARRVGAEPAASAVFEDAVSGIEAGRRGRFGLVVGVAENEVGRQALKEAGADLTVKVAEIGALSADLLERWFAESEHRRPSALRVWPDLRKEMEGRKPAVFLDYDGTLSPLVDQPDQATLSPQMRAVVRRVADRFPTTIVSGRGRDDVARLVGLENVNYAGSHGFDISGPEGDGGAIRHQVAEEVVPVIEQVSDALQRELEEVPGAIVEPKRYTVAVHYRMVEEGDFSRVEAAVDQALERQPDLRKAHGKKVFELRPAFEWDKGKAVMWLLEALGLDEPETLSLYVGDDTTDEDAFRALDGRGIGIVVTEVPRPTAASYSLQDTEEVREFLGRLVES